MSIQLKDHPLGAAAGISIRGVPLTGMYPGQVYWVNGSSVVMPGSVAGSDSNTGSYEAPFATIDYAIGQCTANRGDIIMVAPGYTQTVSAAAGIVADVAGVAIIGLGRGSLRPTITLDTATTADIDISADNVMLSNFLFVADLDAIVHCIDVVSAKNATIHACEFKEGGANKVFIDAIDVSSTTDNDSDGLTVQDCVATSIDDQVDSFIEINQSMDGFECIGNVVSHQHANATGMINVTTATDVLTDCYIADNAYSNLRYA